MRLFPRVVLIACVCWSNLQVHVEMAPTYTALHTFQNHTDPIRLEPRPVIWLPDATMCRDFPGLSRDQITTCLLYPSESAAALVGLQLGIAECHFQFRWHRWNCSSLRLNKSRNPHSTPLLNRGYRESAFAYAVSSAGVMHTVSRACSQGRLQRCMCGHDTLVTQGHRHRLGPRMTDPLRNVAHLGGIDLTDDNQRGRLMEVVPRGQWQWSGCSNNLQFGEWFSELFLDSREHGAADLQAKVNLHNNRAGRMAVITNTRLRCKCHGMSGSCELKTCWRMAPEFRRVGETLKSYFRNAVLVDQGNLVRRRRKEKKRREDEDFDGSSIPEENGPELHLKTTLDNDVVLRKGEKHRRRRQGRAWQRTARDPRTYELLYFQRSPSFCEDSTDFPGTAGRRCHRNSSAPDSCSSLCCGRGYNILRQTRVEQCSCQFHWCCSVVCKNCTVEEWVTACK